MTRQELPPYSERLSEAVAEVARAIAERKPYRAMDISYRHHVRFNELRDEVKKAREAEVLIKP